MRHQIKIRQRAAALLLPLGIALAVPAAWAAPDQYQHQDHPGHEQPQHSENHGRDQTPQGHDNDHRSEPSQASAHYEFRDQDRAQLRRHYQSVLGHVDRTHRPTFQAGEHIPATYRRSITPAPASIRRRLNAPPAGYSVGYYQGYTVVYDPTTYLILSVVDLLTQ